MGHELIDDIRKKTGACTIDLCLDFIDHTQELVAQKWLPQGKESHYSKRGPADSMLNPEKTILEQFNQLRVADNQNYPAFFTINGTGYKLAITKLETLLDDH